ncbi:glycosyltransferase family 9 protein [Herbaspirillum chlorophenolicum]|uniref:glycosyltransferase family 9 protein n=1 Tax=Herbaspirillum chlorophenolicum TaxID=211589 RepID=UPI001E571943|nr:glycosyltransferase family 9 protein [Herbaspirillum chlorophenolicum]
MTKQVDAGSLPMLSQIVPPEVLQKSNKILFVAHLALGDFTYMQACFKAFAEAYPHIKIHLWVDEVRRTYDFRQWRHLQKYVVFDWLQTCPMFEKLYTKTYSPFVLRDSIREAQAEDYPVVVSFGLARRPMYAKMVRKISKKGFVVAMTKRVRFYDFRKHMIYGALDGAIPVYSHDRTLHVSDVYANWFTGLFGIQVPHEKRVPVMDVPQQWKDDALRQLEEWSVAAKDRRKHPLVFLNAFAKPPERSWPLAKVTELVRRMQADPKWAEADFVINTIPEQWDSTQREVLAAGVPRVRLFSAHDHFFQLPAMLEQSDLIVTVETSIMHLANAVRVPVVALMRQINPEWAPIDAANTNIVYTPEHEDWINKISVDTVMEFLHMPMGSAPRFTPTQLQRMAR